MTVRVLLVVLLVGAVPAAAQELLDRVLARVDGAAITLSDARAAIGLGLVEVQAAAAPLETAVARLVDRQLMLSEVERFPPPAPTDEQVAAAAAAMRARAGDGLEALAAATGIDDVRILQAARDSLRIEAYLDQRFGTDLPVSADAVEAYYRAHPETFTRGGALIPFEEAEPAARAGASAERRQGLIDTWVADLRVRAAVTLQLEP
jgi:hypothetical protein